MKLDKRPGSTTLLVGLLLGAATLLGLACGGGGGAAGGGGGGQVGQVSGKVVAPDGTTPVSNARVFVPVSRADDAITETFTGADGAFQLGNVPSGETTIKITKGQWTKTFSASVASGQTTNVPITATTLPTDPGSGAPKMAVVTGNFDRMQDVLAKLGLGTIDADGMLVLGTEKFTLYNGDGSLDGTYKTMSQLLTDPAELAKYSIIFINCGADETLCTDAAVQANLRTYVQSGGRLYVTDWGYNYVEQAFGAGIDFFGDPSGDSDVGEPVDQAKTGPGGIQVNCTAKDDAMKAWLQARGALTTDGNVHIEGFLGGWVVIDRVPTSSKTWVEGPIDLGVTGRGAGLGHERSHGHPNTGGSGEGITREASIRPLTITFGFGTGRVLYSSYHTDETPSPTLRPQEQVLAYLVFEI